MKDLAINKKAEHEYFIEDRLEAGIVLEGWEVKAILGKKINLDNAFVKVSNGEVFLFNAQIQAGSSVCTHHAADPTRIRKLLLNKKEISRLIGKVEVKGYTLIPLKVYQGRKLKVQIGVGKGKKLYDKRQDQKEKDWAREKEQLFKSSVRG